MRLKEAFRGGALGILAAVVGAVASLVSIRYFTRLLDPVEFGIWVLANTIAGWLQALDFGLGQAVQNFIGRYLIFEDRLKVAAAIFGTSLFLLSCAGLVVLFLAVVGNGAMMAHYLNLDSEEVAERFYAGFAAFVALIAVAHALRAGTSTLRAIHRSDVVNIGVLFRAIWPLAVVVLAIRLDLSLNTVFVLVGSLAVATELTLFAAALYLGGRLPWPGPKAIRAAMGELWSPSLQFFIYQLGYNALLLSQPLVIAHLIDPVEAGRFNPTLRLCFIASGLSMVAFGPLVAAFHEVFHTGAHKILRRNFFRLGGFVLVIAAAGAIGFALLGRPFVLLWLGADFAYPTLIYGLLGLNVGLMVLINYMSLFLVGMEKARSLSTIYIFIGIVYISLLLLLTESHAITGVALATVLGNLALSVACGLSCLRTLRQI